MKKLLFSLVIVAALLSCGNNAATSEYVSADSLYQQQDSVFSHADEFSDTIEIKYAKGLKVEYRPDGVHVTISNPDPSAKHSKSEEIIVTQASQRFVCTTALQLGNFEALGLEEKIVGMNSLRNLFSPRIKQQMKSGATIKIGKEGNFDIETVIAARPDYIFVSASKHGGFEALKDCGIPLISHHGYKESSPLGQAEWIKFIGLLTGETRRANAVFADIEQKYLKLSEEVAQSIVHSSAPMPTVASGRQLRDGWYVVGGQSYMAQVFRDAGARYIMSDNEDSGGTTLDFEAVYAKSVCADFWQIDGAFDGEFSLQALAGEDARYADMAAYKNGRVIFCNLSHTPYRELAGVQPHYLLADFVKVFHPEILPHYEPKYYKLIK
ncbi:MAG: ABC transporter substrate-binding protein [Prevotellaceae bacterium]|nr:ABC transporter substrate-binding protein [Candidatus Minthosoma caballi]